MSASLSRLSTTTPLKFRPLELDYEPGMPLGSVAHSTVLTAVHRKSRITVAIKMIDRHNTDFSREVKALAAAQKHPCVIRLFEVVQTSSHCCLVMELGDTDLRGYLNSLPGVFEEELETYPSRSRSSLGVVMEENEDVEEGEVETGSGLGVIMELGKDEDGFSEWADFEQKESNAESTLVFKPPDCNVDIEIRVTPPKKSLKWNESLLNTDDNPANSPDPDDLADKDGYFTPKESLTDMDVLEIDSRTNKKSLSKYKTRKRGSLFPPSSSSETVVTSVGLPETESACYFVQITSALIHCHFKLNVAHRDLKLDNVIVFKPPVARANIYTNDPITHSTIFAHCKLTDFGLSAVCGSEVDGLKGTPCGTLIYTAPEILLGERYDPKLADIWSLGVLLYMLVVGKCPFLENNDNETITMIIDCKYTIPSQISVECKDLIEKMLVKEPAKRAKLIEILNHPWLRSHTSNNGITTTALFARTDITEEIHKAIINKMVGGEIATEHQIKQSIKRDCYNHVTATYYLLAEKMLKYKASSSADDSSIATNGPDNKSQSYYSSNISCSSLPELISMSPSTFLSDIRNCDKNLNLYDKSYDHHGKKNHGVSPHSSNFVANFQKAGQFAALKHNSVDNINHLTNFNQYNVNPHHQMAQHNFYKKILAEEKYPPPLTSPALSTKTVELLKPKLKMATSVNTRLLLTRKTGGAAIPSKISEENEPEPDPEEMSSSSKYHSASTMFPASGHHFGSRGSIRNLYTNQPVGILSAHPHQRSFSLNERCLENITDRLIKSRPFNSAGSRSSPSTFSPSPSPSPSPTFARRKTPPSLVVSDLGDENIASNVGAVTQEDHDSPKESHTNGGNSTFANSQSGKSHGSTPLLSLQEISEEECLN
ncbi:unnamed protein product [Gordionus sp. m RMFG-2023]